MYVDAYKYVSANIDCFMLLLQVCACVGVL